MPRTTATRLKTKLGVYMRAVKNGQEVVVTDRGQPVARLIPFAQAEVANIELEIVRSREPDAPSLGATVVRPISFRGRSPLKFLREDRDRR